MLQSNGLENCFDMDLTKLAGKRKKAQSLFRLSIHGNKDTQRVMTHIAMQAWNILRNKMNQSNQLQSLSMEKFSTSGENVYCVAMPQTGKLAEKKEEAQSLSLAVATLTHNAGYTISQK